MYNRMTKLPLLVCSKHSKGVTVIILKKMNMYCVTNWGFSVGEYRHLRWLAEYLFVILGNVVCLIVV